MTYKAIFLDRDGVINEDYGYTSTIEDFVFFDGVFAACRRFNSLGYKIVVITNQSGIARGYYTEAQFEELTDWMLGEFENENVEIAGVYYCPHHESEGEGEYKISCDCRKPKPGMLFSARDELRIDLAESILIGDKVSDMEAGRAAGVKSCFLISSQRLDEKSNLYDGVFSSLVHVTL